MKRIAELPADNSKYSNGTDQWYKHSFSGLIYTDGVRDVAKEGEAYWLLDAIASHASPAYRKEQPFLVFKLQVADDNTAVLLWEDGNDNVLGKQEIEYTDFPAKECTIWCVDGVMLLPAEY